MPRDTLSCLVGDTLLPGPHPISNIANIARKMPGRTAIISSGEPTSYQTLEDDSTRLATILIEHGVGEGDIVGIMMGRSADIIISILAVWKAGAAYLPLDPDYPPERLVYMLHDSKAVCVLSHSAIDLDLGHAPDQTPGQTPDHAPDQTPDGDLDRNSDQNADRGLNRDLDRDLRQARDPNSASPARRLDIDLLPIRADDPAAAPPGPGLSLSPPGPQRAYVIYTSGSTGKPKGVENTHGALANFLQSMMLRPGITPEDILLCVTTMSFDISILEFFLPLLVGGCVVMATEEEGIDGFDLIDLIADHNVTIMQGTPSTWRMILACHWQGNRKLRALCGGEAMPSSLALALSGLTAELWNMYGPTETTIWSSCHRIDDPRKISIGQPIHETAFYILDENMTILPCGVTGELWIGGAGVARGYLGRRALTEEKFRPDPFTRQQGRIYATGDLATLGADGRLTLQGRRDAQLKIRGYRIEPAEIENILEQHPAISQAAIAAYDTPAAGAGLVGYIVRAAGTEILHSELRFFLRQQLPDYMIPQAFMALDALPLTLNNKIDRHNLPRFDRDRRPDAQQSRAPSARESQIMEVWREVLGIDTIAVTDNFFDLGGQSLQVAEVSATLFARYGFRLSPRAVIYETLEQLAVSSPDDSPGPDENGSR